MLIVKDEEDQLDYTEEEEENGNVIHNNSPPKSPEEQILLENFNQNNTEEIEEVLELKSLNEENMDFNDEKKNNVNGKFLAM